LFFAYTVCAVDSFAVVFSMFLKSINAIIVYIVITKKRKKELFSFDLQ
jgi:hypothetical protein